MSGGLAAYADETGGFVARYGGEEFTLLYEGEADAERALYEAKRAGRDRVRMAA